jgi:hypothetical protein
MGAPVRKTVVAEATQELQAADVLGVLGTIGATSDAPRKPQETSQSSIAPVGLDLARGAATDTGDEEDDDSADDAREPARPIARKKLGKTIVMGTIGACALILIAAGIARVSHASSEPSTATESDPAQNGAAAAPPTTAAAPAPAQAQSDLSRAAPPLDPSSSGTVKLGHPASPGHVWLDGKKVSATSVLVSCGTHQIKVGRSRKHSVDVPCGGEVVVTR